MLPFNSGSSIESSSRFGLSENHFPDYIRRICDYRQMDFEAAFDQLFYLMSSDPQKVYTSFYYRKQTKNQWARDDPAFVVLEMIFVGVAALAYAIAFQRPSFWGYMWAVIYSIVVNWLLVGVAIASTCTYLANKYLRQHHSHSVEQEVEWMFAWDVHANGYICSFFLTNVLQYFLLPVLLNTGVIPCLVSSVLYGLAIVWYAYITHLGYRALPFLGNTQVFLWYPLVAVSVMVLVLVILLVVGVRINLTRIVMAFHYGSWSVKLGPVVRPFGINNSMFEPCKGKGECFSGAWLGHISHLIDNPKLTDFFPDGSILSAKSTVRCEDASYFFFHKMFDTRIVDTFGESPIQTIDMFDFAVLHLSSAERLLYNCVNRSKEGWNLHAKEMNRALKSLSLFLGPRNKEKIRALALDSLEAPTSLPFIGGLSQSISKSLSGSPNKELLTQLSRTLVVIPFLLTSKGESGTGKTYRQRNLKLAFWSIYPIFKNVVGAVVNPVDQATAIATFPFREVMLFNDTYLNGGTCGLPMAAILEVRRRLMTDPVFRSSYDYFYFTEGDQILLARQLPQIYSYLTAHPYTVLAPHRLVVVTPLAMAKYNRTVDSISRIAHYHSRYSCCFDTGSYATTRNHWKPLASPATTITTIFGAYVVAGNANFFDQTYRSCNISERMKECPKNKDTEKFLAYTDEPEIFMKNFRKRVEKLGMINLDQK